MWCRALDKSAWRAIRFGDFDEKKWEVGRQISEGRRKKAEGHWNVDGLVIVVVVVVQVAGFCGLFRASLWSSCCLAVVCMFACG